VLIVGLSGLGVEIAKNVVLAGVKSVTLLDSTPVTLNDYGTNFFLNEMHIGTSRATASSTSLQELNGYVSVSVEEGQLSAEMVASHSIVIMVDAHKDILLQVNGWARDGEVCPLLAWWLAFLMNICARSFFTEQADCSRCNGNCDVCLQ